MVQGNEERTRGVRKIPPAKQIMRKDAVQVENGKAPVKLRRSVGSLADLRR